MSPASPYFSLVAVAVPAATGVATLLLPRRALRLRVTLALVGPITALICIVLHLSEYDVASSDSATDVLDWMPSLHLNISFLVDGLGTFFALLVSGIGVVIVLYARSYFGNNEAALFRFYPMLGFFTTAMMGIVLADPHAAHDRVLGAHIDHLISAHRLGAREREGCQARHAGVLHNERGWAGVSGRCPSLW